MRNDIIAIALLKTGYITQEACLSAISEESEDYAELARAAIMNLDLERLLGLQASRIP